METFGYFTSESSHHASEYVPYFRHSPATTQAHLPQRWDYLRTAQALAGQEEAQTREAVGRLRARLEPSGEFGMPIIAAHTGGPTAEVYINVRNDGWIENLPPEACVEVPAQVKAGGIYPEKMGRLPSVCAGLNLTGIALQTAVVDATSQRDVRALIGAFALDPLTARILDLPRIRQMACELMQAQARWMPPWIGAVSPH